jgi:hypothetical protein
VSQVYDLQTKERWPDDLAWIVEYVE